MKKICYMKCMRITTAYSLSLSRRHSTIFIATLFLIILTIILHLHHHRYSKNQSLPMLGDYDYNPGSYLRGRYPNKSYCDFQYDLPHRVDWKQLPVTFPPEIKEHSTYRVIYNAIIGSAYADEPDHNAVTYVTQATPEFLYHIVEIARYWEGPISLAVFVPDYDLDLTLQVMLQLCRCTEDMAKVSMHLFYPAQYVPKLSPNKVSTTVETATVNWTAELKRKSEAYRNLEPKSRSEYIQRATQNKIKMMTNTRRFGDAPRLKFVDCSGPMDASIVTYRKYRSLLYPINVGRNVARNASKTNYFLVSDIEMVPSDGLASKFLSMVKSLLGPKKREQGVVFDKTVFVVPLFEVERGERIPRDKDTLLQQVSANRASYFHQKTCSHCQRFPGLQSWLGRPAPRGLNAVLKSKREYPYHRWEPLYFGTRNEPWYSETLSWEGRQEKMIQMLEMCLMGYELVILDGGFLCHAAVEKKAISGHSAERRNAAIYDTLIHRLLTRYDKKPRCKAYN